MGPRSPSLGFNVGGLGFLTDVNSSRLRERCHKSGWPFTLEARALLERQFSGTPSDPDPSLNDVVITAHCFPPDKP